MNRVWDTVTKKGTIRSVKITQEDRGLNGTFGQIEFVITYNDGSQLTAKETISYLDGRWTHGLHDLHATARAESDLDSPAFANATISADDVEVKGTGVSLRIPEGSIVNSFNREIDHPRLKILIGVNYTLGRTFANELELAEIEWKKPRSSLTKKEQIQGDPKWKRVLFEGTTLNVRDTKWTRFTQVVGNGDQGVTIWALAPRGETARKLTRESLLSMKWNPVSPEVVLAHFDFEITPAQSFVLYDARADRESIAYGVKNEDPTSSASARFMVVKRGPLSPKEDRKTAFDGFVESRPDRFIDPLINGKKPFTTRAFEGFEAVGTLYHVEDQVTVFRYAAALYCGKNMYTFEGIAPVRLQTKYEKEFREMTQSFKPRGTP